MRKCIFKIMLVLILSVSANANSDETYIIENGKPNAEIVIAENVERMVALGALELMYYLEKINGLSLIHGTEESRKNTPYIHPPSNIDEFTPNVAVLIANAGEEGAEGDPMNYVVGPRVKPGGEWFINLARRRPREGDKHRLQGTHALCVKRR